MKIRDTTLLPKACELVRLANAGGRNLDEAFVGEAAEQVYLAHRLATRSDVAAVNLEKFWPQVNASWKGKYRAIVKEAIVQEQNTGRRR